MTIRRANKFKHDFTEQIFAPLKVPVILPLRSWPFKRHDRADEMEAYAAIPSALPAPPAPTARRARRCHCPAPSQP